MSKILTLDKVPLYGICDFNGQKIVKLRTNSSGIDVAFWPYDVNFGITHMNMAAAQSTVCNYTGCTVAETVEIENNAIKSFSKIEYKVINDD